jgi:hypothetical protein
MLRLRRSKRTLRYPFKLLQLLRLPADLLPVIHHPVVLRPAAHRPADLLPVIRPPQKKKFANNDLIDRRKPLQLQAF